MLDLYPAQLTSAEVVMALCGAEAPFRDRDDLQCAVRDLGYAGLVHRRDELIWRRGQRSPQVRWA